MICNLCFPSVQNVGRILVPVRRATARLVIEHILVNDKLKYDPKDFFVWNAARGSASWRRAVAPLVTEHVFVNECLNMIQNFSFYECVMSHMNESQAKSQSHINESCHISMSHVT